MGEKTMANYSPAVDDGGDDVFLSWLRSLLLISILAVGFFATAFVILFVCGDLFPNLSIPKWLPCILAAIPFLTVFRYPNTQEYIKKVGFARFVFREILSLSFGVFLYYAIITKMFPWWWIALVYVGIMVVLIVSIFQRLRYLGIPMPK